MNWQYTPYILPSTVAVVLSLTVMIIAWRVWRRRRLPTAGALALLSLATAEWALLNVLELSTADLPTRNLWTQIEYIGVICAPVLWLVFALCYTGHDRRLTRRTLAGLAIVPGLALILIFTNPPVGPGWMWHNRGVLSAGGAFMYMDVEFGPAWWVCVAYSYLLIVISSVLMVLMLVRSLSLYRSQIATILLGAAFPFICNVLFVFKVIPHLDLTPFAFSLSGVCFALASLRFNLFDIVPMARDLAVDSMDDGMLVLDMQNRIVDTNPAMGRILDISVAQMIGRPAPEVLRPWPHLVERFRNISSAQTEITVDGYHYDLHISPLLDREGRSRGRLVVLRDITAQVQAAQALQVEQAKAERLLLNILPAPIARRLKDGEEPISDGFSAATVLFADLVGFTSFAEQRSPQEVVVLLNELFSRYDALAETYCLEKIKTIGDAYMVVSGVPTPVEAHARSIADMALEMIDELARFNRQTGQALDIRIGISSGPVVAGVIGRKKFIYDLWGDTVNTANRMEHQGVTGKIHLTQATYNLLRADYEFDERGEIEVKGKGVMRTWFLKGKKAQVSSELSPALDSDYGGDTVSGPTVTASAV